jgi:hypothetical protein
MMDSVTDWYDEGPGSNQCGGVIFALIFLALFSFS